MLPQKSGRQNVRTLCTSLVELFCQLCFSRVYLFCIPYCRASNDVRVARGQGTFHLGLPCRQCKPFAVPSTSFSGQRNRWSGMEIHDPACTFAPNMVDRFRVRVAAASGATVCLLLSSQCDKTPLRRATAAVRDLGVGSVSRGTHHELDAHTFRRKSRYADGRVIPCTFSNAPTCDRSS